MSWCAPRLQTQSSAPSLADHTQRRVRGHSANTTRCSAHVHDISLGVDAHFLLKTAHAADLERVPDLIEFSFVRRAGWLHYQLLEAVLLAMLASVRTRDSLCAFARDCLCQFISPGYLSEVRDGCERARLEPAVPPAMDLKAGRGVAGAYGVWFAPPTAAP